ncbi:MAG TPA: DUF1439 domain-containing protein [Janthinobacterium sp.]|nr:DUF1439 domain-containing protein [Janthinobacterium sp.]
MTLRTKCRWLRRLGTIAAPLLAGALLASCASIIGPRQVELPLARLQQGLDKRFPVNNQILTMFDVRLSRPQLALLPDDDRVALAMDATVSPPFIGQSWHGSLAMSGHLTLDPARNAVFIGAARVDRFAIDGVDEALRRQLAKMASLVTERVVEEVPLYNFRPEDLRYAGVQFVPTKITTTRTALVVTFEPAR